MPYYNKQKKCEEKRKHTHTWMHGSQTNTQPPTQTQKRRLWIFFGFNTRKYHFDLVQCIHVNFDFGRGVFVCAPVFCWNLPT